MAVDVEGAGRFAGRVAVVAGGTSGIGLAVAERLLREGASVAVVGRDADRAEAARSALGPAGDGPDRLEVVLGDVALDADRAVGRAVERFGRLDVLVNNAGFTIGSRAIDDIGDDDWAAVEATNLDGTFRMTRAAVPALEASPAGAVVCVASISARGSRFASNVAYAAAKGGVLSFAQAAAVQLGPRGIRVNSVCPGPTRTPSFVEAVAAVAERDGVDLATAEATVVASFRPPLGRVVEPSEIAAAVAFLASDDASAVTGQTLNVDCGLVFD